MKRMTHQEIYQLAIDGLTEQAVRMKRLAALARERGDSEKADKCDAKRKECSEKIDWLQNELQEGV